MYIKGINQDINPIALIPKSVPAPECSPQMKNDILMLSANLHNNIAGKNQKYNIQHFNF